MANDVQEDVKRLLILLLLKLGSTSDEIGSALNVDSSVIRKMMPSRKVKKLVKSSEEYLRDLRRKLARRQVTFIQQYSPKVWPMPPPKGEPLIEKIEIVRPDPVVALGRNS